MKSNSNDSVAENIENFQHDRYNVVCITSQRNTYYAFIILIGQHQDFAYPFIFANTFITIKW